MYLMADGLARLLAPILSFSADEFWRYLPGAREDSVHLALFPTREELERMHDPPVAALWEGLIKVRDRVLGEIEPLRKDKQIGSSLQAKVVLTAGPVEMDMLRSRAADLPMLFIVSDVELRPADLSAVAPVGAKADELQISIEKASGVKCERCWRYVPAVSPDAGICDRCQNALAEAVRS
jgi:isoleucyl-tRNA synthetase